MMPLGWEQFAKALSGATLFGRMQEPVRRIVTDSRGVEPGDLFWALRGPRHDGEAFVDEALGRGAAGCVVSRRSEPCKGYLIQVPDTGDALVELARWYRRQMSAVVVGVTGSVGKTTAREMIYRVLSAAGSGVRSRSNYNNRVGLPLSLFDLEPEHTFGVFELGASGPGEIAELASVCSPGIGVLTAIGQAHLEGFGCTGGVLRAKAELFEALPVDGLAVVNGDDFLALRATKRAPCPVVRVGQGPASDVMASEVQAKPEALTFVVDRQTYSVPVLGRHFLTAALSAIAVGREFGLDDGRIADALAGFQSLPQRCREETIGGVTVLDDTYNASPESARAALDLLGQWPSGGKKVVVLGDMRELGPESARLHEQLGADVTGRAQADLLMVCGDYASHVVRGAVEAGMPVDQASVGDDPRDMAERLDDWLEPGDVVLVKGSRALALERVVEAFRSIRTDRRRSDDSVEAVLEKTSHY